MGRGWARVMSGVSTYTTEVGDAICERIASGESLRSVCRDKAMPNKSTVLRWLVSEQAFRAQYEVSKDVGIDERFEEIDELVAKESDTPRARLIWDMRRWELSKLAPKKYGDKITQENTGEGGGPVRYQNMQPTELDAEIARLQGLVGPVKS